MKRGQIYSKLTLLEEMPKRKYLKVWRCLCDCGKETVVQAGNILNNHTTSCGCFRKQKAIESNSTHGLANTKVYRVWRNMHTRCENTNTKDYKNYGGRGISVCISWFKFETFYKDMGDAPEGLSLDRINNNKGYSKCNCKWSTKSEQAFNRRKKYEIKK